MKHLNIGMSIRFIGGEADKNKIDLYDGASSLFGLAKSIQLTAHYLLNGKVAFQAPSTKGVQLFMLPSERGSFKQKIELDIDKTESLSPDRLSKITEDVAKDFISYQIGVSTGHRVKPKTDFVRSIASNNQSDLAALSEAIDGPLKEAHRFIGSVNSIKRMSVFSGTSPIAEFNGTSLRFVITREVSSSPEWIEGSVSAFNVNSGAGRLFDESLSRTVPFQPDKEAIQFDRGLLTWSLDQKARRRNGELEFFVRRITNSEDETKSYLMHDCRKPEKS